LLKNNVEYQSSEGQGHTGTWW